MEKKKLVQTRIPEKTHAKITKLAVASGSSLATWVRQLLMQVVKDAEK